MHIIVCLKRVPDAASRIAIDRNGLDIKRDIQWILNPFDEIALHAAIAVKERHGGTITLIYAGAEDGEDILRKGIAFGADHAVYIKDAAVNHADGITIARAISSVIRPMPFDIILCGRRASDTDAGITGPAIAAFLDIPVVSSIKRLDIAPATGLANALTDGGAYSVDCNLPALFTVDRGLCEPRYPTLSGIMGSKKTSIRYLDLKAVGVDTATLSAAPVQRTNIHLPPKTRKGVILQGDMSEQVKTAARFIRDATEEV